MKTQRYLLRTSFRSYAATTAMLLFSIVIALFCVNVVFGFAESTYRVGSAAVDYTTITIAGMDSETRHKDMMAELKSYDPSAALYVCRSADHAVLVGFDGTDGPGYWWPHMAGDFVNDTNVEGYPHVVYLTDFEAERVAIGSSFDLDGKDYRIIGYGWIAPANFMRLISRSSPQTVFDFYQGGSSYEGPLDDVSHCFRIIPYEAFWESYEPDLILLHFPKMNYGQMLKMTDRLSEMFPNSTVTPPTQSSNGLREHSLLLMRRYIPLYLVLTQITVVLVIYEFYRKLHAELLILRTYGMSKRRLRWQIIGEIVLLYILAEAIALLLQRMLREPLTELNAAVLPTVQEAALGFAALLVISLLLSLPGLWKTLNLQRSEEG